MITADAIGWISNFFFVYGVWAVAKKKIIGFYCNLVANALYAVVALMVDTPSLFWLSILLAIINVYGIYNWSKDVKKI